MTREAPPDAAFHTASEEELDALYRAPLAEFVARRDALAKRLETGGATEDAGRIKALRKPIVVAWAINRLHLEQDGLAKVETASAALRAALATARTAEERRGAIDARRRAVEAAVEAAARTLRDAGTIASPDLLRRIERTILAIVTGAGGPEAPRAGRLDRELEPPGFEALADSVAASPAPAAKRPPTQNDRERERALEQAQRALDDAEARLERASAGVEAARARIAEAESALRAARAEADAARREIAAARGRRDALRGSAGADSGGREPRSVSE